MTVQQMIDELTKIENKEMEVGIYLDYVCSIDKIKLCGPEVDLDLDEQWVELIPGEEI